MAVLLQGLQHPGFLRRGEFGEYRDLLQKIQFYTSILENAEVLRGELKREIAEIRETFATPRRTEVVTDALSGIDIEDLIPDDEVVITLSRRGYMKRTNLENYQQQKRGGKKEPQLPPHVRFEFEKAIVCAGLSAKGNRWLTFRFASPEDWWFHAQGVPGAHVIMRANAALTDWEFEELAAFCASLAMMYEKR